MKTSKKTKEANERRERIDCLLRKLSDSIRTTSSIDQELFVRYNVKRGLRNEDHSGVLVGLTTIGDVVGYQHVEG